MSKKHQIDKQRESAVTLSVGDDGDSSAIKELLSTSNALYVIKEEGVYKTHLADDIDPSRTNYGIPNLSQRVLSSGYNNEIVARILLTAKYLFDENNATAQPFISSLFEGSIDLTKHILELQEMVFRLKEEIIQKEDKLLKKNQREDAFSLPSIPDLNTRLHNIFVKADKSKDTILSLYRLHFLPDVTKKPQLADYDSAINTLSDMDPELVLSWGKTKKVFNLIRNTRNASEHPKEGQKIILTDFAMMSDGHINSPFVEIQHKDTPIELRPLVELLDFVQDLMLSYSENALVFLRRAVLLNNNPFSEWVSEFDIEERRHPLVSYYRSINTGGIKRILG